MAPFYCNSMATTESPKVDIYLPTYKPRAEQLRPALESILNQTEQNWRLWINNQVSDVSIEPIVNDYLHDERITLHHNRDHPGIGANWNDCFQYGSTPVIQYMFDDDLWAPHYLETGLRTFDDNPDVGMVSLGHDYLFEGSLPTESSYHELKSFLEANARSGKHDGLEILLWWFDHGLHPNIIGEPMFVMLRRDTVNAVGRFREDMSQNLDSEYWARVLTKTNWFYQPGVYGQFRVHGESASMENYRAGRGLFDRLRMMHSILPLLPPEHRPAARKSLRKHTGQMAEKFLQRYAPAEQAHYRDGESIPRFVIRNWKSTLKAGGNYLKKRQQ